LMAKRSRETILVMSSHSDDFVLGAGGTVAKYTKEGKKVLVIIFSYGESSHPWLKEKVIQKLRARETLEAAKLLNCKTYFFDLHEFKFTEEYQKRGLEKKFLSIIESVNPSKIFTHSGEDPHPDHHAVYKITMELYEKLKNKPEVYIYSIWNPVSFKTQHPVLYVKISETFSLKLKALKTFRSQMVHIAYPTILLFWRNIIDGVKIKAKFAEKFFRIK
jgi:LmbE family N-acetylglucosaminyl deacetylase